MSPLVTRLLLIGALAASLVACGDGDEQADAGQTIEQRQFDAVPARLLDLSVELEEVSDRLERVKRPYVDAVALYSLRDEDLLQATLQISRFNDEADLEDEQFRLAVVGQIGSTAPRPFRMDDDIVYLTTGIRQSVAVFFRDQAVLVLSTRESYERPRALLREAMGIEL